jgi:hypothetical protein
LHRAPASPLLSISRRGLAAGLLTLAGGAALPHWAAAQDDDTQLAIELPPAGSAGAASFEVFLALSQIVLIEADLDRRVARRLHELFSAEPYGPQHVVSCYGALRATFLMRGRRGGQQAVARATLSSGESWFISHLVTTWFVGIYYHAERPVSWLTLHDAMMYRPVRDLLPVRYVESVGFGNWANPPKKAR